MFAFRAVKSRVSINKKIQTVAHRDIEIDPDGDIMVQAMYEKNNIHDSLPDKTKNLQCLT